MSKNTKYHTLILEYYGNTCANCKRGYIRLDIDHVLNDGGFDRVKHNGIGYYRRLYTRIINGEADKFQLLCRTCHLQKHRIQGTMKREYRIQNMQRSVIRKEYIAPSLALIQKYQIVYTRKQYIVPTLVFIRKYQIV